MLRPYHNPENLDESLVPDGWRFRYADEIPERARTQCTTWMPDIGKWDHYLFWHGCLEDSTYIVPVNS